MRFFLLPGVRLVALPPDPHGSLSCWVHHSNSDITREHLKPDQIWDLEEITEVTARVADPEMFTECLDRPYFEARSMIHFYIDRANECVGFASSSDQVNHHLVEELGFHEMNITIATVLMAIDVSKPQSFGVLAYDKKQALFVNEGNARHIAESYQLQKRITSDKTHLLWWRYNTLEKNLTPAVFNERLKHLK